ncbi:hypothetical protein GWK47_003405 [Chionoecetes opilio]|uniref:Uncharacterized protein n=1 Tax=Chionoecetes opilio TaxID=41210 RepID=A0A8J5D5H5_CHIOP|nr:hypothetical protein GWK47_003405 [Chionoecetes opilio]
MRCYYSSGRSFVTFKDTSRLCEPLKHESRVPCFRESAQGSRFDGLLVDLFKTGIDRTEQEGGKRNCEIDWCLRTRGGRGS